MIETVARRRFLQGMGLLFAAPAIVRATSLMQIQPLKPLVMGMTPIPESATGDLSYSISTDSLYVYDGAKWLPIKPGETIEEAIREQSYHRYPLQG